jgi:hypothetical protein
LTFPEKKVNFQLLKLEKGKEKSIMIDILNVLVYAGGPSIIVTLIAYWSLKGGRNASSIGQKRKLLTAKAREYSK